MGHILRGTYIANGVLLDLQVKTEITKKTREIIDRLDLEAGILNLKVAAFVEWNNEPKWVWAHPDLNPFGFKSISRLRFTKRILSHCTKRHSDGKMLLAVVL